MDSNKKIVFPLLGLLLVTLVMIVILRWEGRLWFSASGAIRFWVSDAWGPENSQQFTDPYSFSHALHGILFFGLLYLFANKLSLWWRGTIAVLIEAIWEVAENSPAIIDRYREAGALGYSGDTIFNSIGDLFYCGLGFVLAYYLGFWKSLALFILVEIGLILTIKDSLIINVIMLIYPLESIKQWQSAFLIL